MAYEPINTEELKKRVLLGRKRPMNMAFNPGPKGADLLIIERLKAPEVIGRWAKKAGDGPKVAFGSYEIDARKLIFTASQELPNLAKRLRRYLKTIELSYKIEVLDLDGNTLDADLEDEEGNETPPNAPIPGRVELTKRLFALQEPVAAFGAAGAPLKKAMAKVVAAINTGFFGDADDYLCQIELAIAKAKQGKSAPTKSATPEAAKALMARTAALKDRLDGLPDKAAKAVRNALVQVVSLLQSRDLEGASAKLASAEKVVQTLTSAPESANAQAEQTDRGDDPDEKVPAADVPPQDTQAARDWPATLARLETAVSDASKAGRGDLAAIDRAFSYGKARAEANDFEAAMRAAEATFDLIELASAMPDEGSAGTEIEAEALTSETVMAVAKSRLQWTTTRNTLQAELIKLKMAIDAQTAGISGLEDVASQTEMLLEYLEELDTSLQDTLDALINTSDGVRRQQLRDEAQQIITSYRAVLDTAFFKAVDDNGFVSTTIRDTALTALGEVDTALAA